MIRLAALALTPLLACAAAPDLPVVVNDADFACAGQTWSALHRDTSIQGTPLRLAGKTFEHGLGAHAISEIPVSVPTGAARLSGAVGVDDEVGLGKGSIKFRILSGDAVLWESPIMKAGDAPAIFDIPTPSTRHRKLYLQADGLDNTDSDHADWVDLHWVAGESPAVKPARVMTGAEFGITPNVRDDQSPAMHLALAALREAPGSTLRLAKGDYHFWHTGAMKRHFHISNHDQPDWQPVAIPLVDLRGVTLDGAGSTFIFHGKVQPVLIADSEKTTVRGIGIDYARPHHSQGIITAIAPGAYELFLDPVKYPHELRNGWFVHTGEGWAEGDWGFGIVFSSATHEIVAGTGDFGYRGKVTDLGTGHYHIEKDLTKTRIKAGDLIAMRHSSRPHPAFTLYRAKDTILENAPVHSALGMAILAQRSENIRITGGGVNLRPGTDRVFTSNADADHFSNCRGLITVENALFEGMMDDAINVHATCLRIEEKTDPRTLRCKYVHGQSVGFEVFLPGETLRFIDAKHLTPDATRKVAAVRRTGTDEVVITLDAPAPDALGKGDAVENADWFPAVVFRGNTVRNNRARGSLFTTPHPVLVENNRFLNSSGSALLLAGDANGWYESGGCGEVIIRGNLFRNNLTSRYQFTEALIAIYPEVPDLKGQTKRYHANVRIEKNTFETFDVPLLYAISTHNIAFTGNTVKYNDDYPAWKKPPFTFRGCDAVTIGANTVTRRAAPVKWTTADIALDHTPASSVTLK